MVLGEISPKISTITVKTAVDTVAPRSWLFRSSVKRSVPIADARILTMLFPISIVEMRVS